MYTSIFFIPSKIQNPARQLGKSMIFVSKQGTGKTLLMEIWKKLTGDYVAIVNMKDVCSEFQAHIALKTVVVLEELQKGLSAETCDLLKQKITESEKYVNEKHQKKIKVRNYTDMYICSNHEVTIKIEESD